MPYFGSIIFLIDFALFIWCMISFFLPLYTNYINMQPFHFKPPPWQQHREDLSCNDPGGNDIFIE